ncbi:MAG: hypothetical protein ABSF74_07390 [Dehalococcoidia bacterium]|jgi:molybdopterin converting factor small subunit
MEIRIRIKYLQPFKRITGKTVDKIVLSTDKISLRELICMLAEKYGTEFTKYFYDEQGNLIRGAFVVVNHRSITDYETVFDHSFECTFVIALSGG